MTVGPLLPARLEMIQRSAAMTRFHTWPVLKAQSVGEHTYGVLWHVYMIEGGEPDAQTLIAALQHDAGEYKGGDMPGDFKKALPLEVRLAFNALEDGVLPSIGIPPADCEGRRAYVVKMADMLEGVLFCLKEYQMGNTLIKEALQNYTKWIEAAQPVGWAEDVLNYVKEHSRELTS